MEKLNLKHKGPDPKDGKIFKMIIQPDLLERIKKSREYMIEEKRSELSRDEYLSVKDDKGIRRFSNKIWIPNMTDLKKDILSKAHESRYSIHPGSTKMYQDFKKN